jgi:hypothetical protein
MRMIWLMALSCLAPPASAAVPAQSVGQVSQQRLRLIVQSLIGFGTRHTLSSQTDPKRGIGAAQRWTEAEFSRYTAACGGCLTIETPSDLVSGERLPEPTRVTDVVAIQKGSAEPDRVVIIAGHIDSRVSDVMNATADAPGANDDASGVAAVLEAARLLSRQKFPVTIVYAVLAGEEQGLFGGRILADYAKSHGWQVTAMLNNDIIGNSCGSDRSCDGAHVRVFSEGVRSDATAALIDEQRRLGGENDSPSRNLSRFIAALGGRSGTGLNVRQVWRRDRFGRGGDHIEMLQAGFPAVRFTAAVENYDRQHQDVRVEKGRAYGDTIGAMDFAYLTKVVRLNVAALAVLASAPAPPLSSVEGAVSNDTNLSWKPVPRAVRYRIRWRPTDAGQWTNSLVVPAGGQRHTLKNIRVDDWIFGVSAIAADGSESPVSSAVPGGAFGPAARQGTAAAAPRR